MASALAHAGRPIVVTSLVLACGFAMGLFGRLETTREFSVLAASTIALALGADLVLLPALLLRGGERERLSSLRSAPAARAPSTCCDPMAAFTSSSNLGPSR